MIKSIMPPVRTDTQERRARLEFLERAVGEFKTEDFGTPESGCELLRDFGRAPRGATPKRYPVRASHPRVLFSESDLPKVIETVEKRKDARCVKKFKEDLATDITGILGEPSKRYRGFHNFDIRTLSAIQSHALAYALYRDEYYGYSAIYAMKNFLLTLDIDYIFSDQCREFGMVMYITACVYDWCHALLSEKDKLELALGVQHRICTGHVKNTKRGILASSSTVKMEMGFPPVRQSGMVGHGAEYQLQRDYLAMAIAVYDELPSWYELVGGRFFNEYAPPRQIYYEAALAPQGMSYGPWRFLADCYGAALIQAATGEAPYNTDMARVVLSFLANETSDFAMFRTGDCGPTHLDRLLLSEEALMLSHVFHESEEAGLLRLVSHELESEDSYTCKDFNTLLCAEGVIFNSREVSERAGEYRDHIPMLYYNGGYVGQYISRSRWGYGSAVTLMRIGERGTANHDHEDAGTFQLDYKGLHSGQTGEYNTYGSPEWAYHFQATLGKNGLLFFNPKYADTEPIYQLDENGERVVNSFGNYIYQNAARVFYSGGQKTNRLEPQSLYVWLSGRYDRARVTGHADGYKEEGTPEFSYIAGDITRAYTAAEAMYAHRSMLTAFTNDERRPMLLFVYDNAIPAQDTTVKFLLQINGEEAPTIDCESKLVTVEDGEGQLLLKNIHGVNRIEAIGGGNGKNSVINGVSCQDNLTQSFFGRVELTAEPTRRGVDMLNVLAVGDRGDSDIPEYKSIEAIGSDGKRTLVGGSALGVAALFATDTEPCATDSRFTLEGEGELVCYIAGLHPGEWQVTIGGEEKLYTVKEDEGLMRLTAKGGVTISLSL